MDIAGLLESHRTNLLDDLKGRLEGHASLTPYQVVEICYDRATIKSLLAALNNGEVKPLGQAALTTPTPKPSHRVKAGSKAAKARALKAGETRRKNLAARAGEPPIQKGGVAPADPALSPATHLAPRTPEGGAA